jgi:hypothetical protein
MNLKYTLQRLRWIKALFSPFKPFKVKFYAGKTQIGMPYFLPRKWVKATPKLATKAALEYIEKEKRYNELNPNSTRKIKPFEEIFQDKMKCSFAIPLTVGFSYCSLGYKTKWTATDFRYEWSPILSFVFFGYQIALIVYSPYRSYYWEPWLYYEYATDKTKSKRERIEQCRKEASQTWTSNKQGEESVTTDYYTKILKSKYLTMYYVCGMTGGYKMSCKTPSLRKQIPVTKNK